MGDLKQLLWTRENFLKLCLLFVGLTLFPPIVYFVGQWFVPSWSTIGGFYRYFYGSLIDMGQDGLITWGIACGPYLLYEIYLLFEQFTGKKVQEEAPPEKA